VIAGRTGMWWRYHTNSSQRANYRPGNSPQFKQGVPTQHGANEHPVRLKNMFDLRQGACGSDCSVSDSKYPRSSPIEGEKDLPTISPTQWRPPALTIASMLSRNSRMSGCAKKSEGDAWIRVMGSESRMSVRRAVLRLSFAKWTGARRLTAEFAVYISMQCSA